MWFGGEHPGNWMLILRPFLPIGADGELKQVFLVTFIDDATRLVLHGSFYPTLDQIIVEDCFRIALQKHGLPASAYFDYTEKYTMPKYIVSSA